MAEQAAWPAEGGEDLEGVLELAGPGALIQREGRRTCAAVHQHQPKPAPELAGEGAAAREVAGNEVEVEVDDLRARLQPGAEKAAAHVGVERVVKEQRGPRQRRGVEKVLEIPPSPLGRVVPVDEHEVDVAALAGEAIEELREQHVAVAGVELRVGGPGAPWHVLEVE